MFPGVGTVVNVVTVLIGATLGVVLGNRLPARTRDLVTDALGLVTLLIAATSAHHRSTSSAAVPVVTQPSPNRAATAIALGRLAATSSGGRGACTGPGALRASTA